MRALLAFLVAGAILAGCGGGGSATAPSVLAPVTLPAPSGTSETPLSASAFTDSVGVNAHMTYVVGGYNTDFATWSPLLVASGIQHVRDGVCPTFVAQAWCAGVASARMDQLANSGIKFDLVTAMNDGMAYVASYAQTMSASNAIEAFEGPNECDASADCPSAWKSAEAAWQQQLYALHSPAVEIVAPSMTSAAGYSALGNLGAFADVGNIHDFAGNSEPESFAAAPQHLQWAAAMTGSSAVWSTENGYDTDTANGVPQTVQARYLPRMLLDHLRLGIMRTYIYQLFDFGSDGGGHMGLLNANYAPKPAWTVLTQLMRLFSDSGASPRAPLAYSITGDTSGALDHVLFQRSDGTYMLALWLAEPAYDPATGAVLPIASETVTVALPASTAAAALTPFGDSGAEAAIPLTGTAGAFRVPVRSTVSVLEFRT